MFIVDDIIRLLFNLARDERSSDARNNLAKKRMKKAVWHRRTREGGKVTNRNKRSW